MSDDNIYSIVMPAAPTKNCSSSGVFTPFYLYVPYSLSVPGFISYLSRPATHAELLDRTENFYIDFYLADFSLPYPSGRWISLRPQAYGNLLVADYRLAPVPPVLTSYPGCSPVTNVIATFISIQEAVAGGLAPSSQLASATSVLVRVEFYVTGSLALVLEAKRLCRNDNNQWGMRCAFKAEWFTFPAGCTNYFPLALQAYTPLRAMAGPGIITWSRTVNIDGAAASGSATATVSGMGSAYRYTYWDSDPTSLTSINASAPDCPSGSVTYLQPLVSGSIRASYLNIAAAQGGANSSCRSTTTYEVTAYKFTQFGDPTATPPVTYTGFPYLFSKPSIFSPISVDVPLIPTWPPTGVPGITQYVGSGTCTISCD